MKFQPSLFMKLPVLCAFSLLATAAASFAGSFGGPGPWSDQSPLQSGIDGSYQATARGLNLTGVFRFAYENNVQSPVASANQYSFFVDGQVVTGGVVAAINGKNLAGVLGGQDFSVPTNNNGSTELPLVFIVRGNRANGNFNGQMNLEDPMSAFNGKGKITPSPLETNTVILIQTNQGNFAIASSNITTADITAAQGNVSVVPFVIPGSNIPETDFTFEGVRTSVFAQTAGTSASGTATTTSTSTSTTAQ
jgi:hypothetical protein